MKARLTSADFAAKEVKYHAPCRLKYQQQAEARDKQRNPLSNSKKHGNSSWHFQREVHNETFKTLHRRNSDFK